MLKLIPYNEQPNFSKKIKELYIKSFPSVERAPFFMLKRKAKKSLNDFFAIFDEDDFIGLLYTISYKDILFIFYFAIEETKRNYGYGTKVLQHLIEQNKGKRIILNIEEVVSHASNFLERTRRKNFYLKNGFRETGIKTIEKKIVHELLVCGSDVSQKEYINLFIEFMGKFLTNRIIKLND